jgi:excisionase family DNA binding protein
VVSADVIAERRGVTKDSVYAWIAQRGMPGHRVGRLWKFQVIEVDAWVRRDRTAEPFRNGAS